MMASEQTPLVEQPRGSMAGAASVYKDDVTDMTIGRRIARYLSQYEWYLPSNALKLDDAWAYFEHYTLNRFYIDEDTTDHDHYPRAEPGEADKKTKLYPIWSTPETDLADFGTGIGIYFFTLRSLSIITFLAGLLSIPTLAYFGSDEYNPHEEFSRFEVLRSSAVCTDTTWEACPSCTKSQWNFFPVSFERYAEATGPDGSILKFIQINNCYINRRAGITSYVVMLFVCASLYVLAKVSRRREAKLDQASLTTADYSVEVVNPPHDARNVEEWKEFFGQFGDIAAISIALDNEELLRKLIDRRKLVYKLEDRQPAGTEFSLEEIPKDSSEALPWYMALMGEMTSVQIRQKIQAIDDDVTENLSKKEFNVSNIFVVFQEEKAQKVALEALQRRGIDLLFNRSGIVEEKKFRGTHVLRVVEPAEPSSIRWQDLDETLLVQIAQRLLTTFLTAVLVLCGCALVIVVRVFFGTVYAAFAVSGVNSAAPYMCRFLVEKESHATEGSRQASLYFKITACLWITTACLTSIITPFVDTLKNDKKSLIPAMYSIFITEMFVGPLVQFLDIPSHLKRHILAPRATNQRAMENYFQGTAYDLSERYTSATNVLFLTFYYALLFPAGFFFASATLLIQYVTDRYCLLRVWARSPVIGNDIANMSRTYFFSAALVVYAIMSSYGFASFPYDNACGGDTPVPSSYIGSFDAETGDGKRVEIDLSNDQRIYSFCNQDMIQYDPPAFPALSSKQQSEWMTAGQATFVDVYGYTVVAILIATILVVANQTRRLLKTVFVSPSPVLKKDHPNKPFDPDLGVYIPEAKIVGDQYPLLFCDISGFDEELIPWVDPVGGYQPHNATNDIPEIKTLPIFSTVHQFSKI